jgi:hypothetical protein
VAAVRERQEIKIFVRDREMTRSERAKYGKCLFTVG